METNMASSSSKTALIAGERVVMSSDGDVLVLTNRVRLDERARGTSKFVSMMLDAASSCALVTRSSPILLVVGAVAGLLALMQQDNNQGVLLLVGAVFVVTYFATRKAVLTIT